MLQRINGTELADSPKPVIQPKLSAALSKAQQACKAVEKDSRNDFHRYAYASAESIIAEAKMAMAGTGLSVMPHSPRMITNGPQQMLHRAVTIMHESGESVEMEPIEWPICPDRGRPLDKAYAAAMTTSLAYFLRDLLLMPRVDPSDDISGRDDRDREPSRQPQKQDSEAGKPDLKNDAFFYAEFDRVAALRHVNTPDECRKYLKFVMSSAKYRDVAADSGWRFDLMRALDSGKFDEAMRPRPAKATAEPPKPVAKIGGDPKVDSPAPVEPMPVQAKPVEPPEQEVTAEDLQPMESFWAWMKHVLPPTVPEKDIVAAVTAHAKGMRKTPEQLPGNYLLRIFLAAKDGRFGIPGGRITDPPSVPLAQVVDETPL